MTELIPQREQIGPLECITMRPADTSEIRLSVVLCHGFGAPGTDLVALGPELVELRSELADHVEWIFPAAPLTLDHLGYGGGRAWWYLDMERLQLAIAAGKTRDLRADRPEGLLAARDALVKLVSELSASRERPLSSIYLGGFSQGSMLATDVMLQLPEPIAGLCVMSGTLLNEAEWRRRAAAVQPVPVLQSHGRTDPILPFEGAGWLRELLEQNGFPVDFLPFTGAHTIPYTMLQALADRLVELVADDSEA